MLRIYWMNFASVFRLFGKKMEARFCMMRLLFTRIITSWNDNIDVYLQQNLTSPRRLERLDVPLRAILRAGASELMSRQSESIGSIIRAYMALADCFYEGRESKLVNAVLDKIAGLDEGRRASLTSEDSPCEDSSCKDSPCEDSSCEDSPCEDSSCEDSSCKDSPCEDSS